MLTQTLKIVYDGQNSVTGTIKQTNKQENQTFRSQNNARNNASNVRMNHDAESNFKLAHLIF